LLQLWRSDPPGSNSSIGVVVERRVREVLIFEIGGRRYGLPAPEVRELLRAVAISPLPPGSDPFEGVIDLRGAVVAVVDLRARLRLEPRAVQPSDHLIIMETGRGRRPIALRVDRALELVVLEPGAFEPLREREPGLPDAAEIARLPDGLVPMLDLDSLDATAWSAPIASSLE
jgi:purine-binding chemotaxis protein CheW